VKISSFSAPTAVMRAVFSLLIRASVTLSIVRLVQFASIFFIGQRTKDRSASEQSEEVTCKEHTKAAHSKVTGKQNNMAYEACQRWSLSSLFDNTMSYKITSLVEMVHHDLA
jgi:hypothetical protein